MIFVGGAVSGIPPFYRLSEPGATRCKIASMKLHPILRLSVLLALSLTTVQAGDPTVMHCFAWTPVKEATPADWQAFYKASDALPQKIKGITRVWTASWYRL
jgi:hypothetical protein